MPRWSAASLLVVALCLVAAPALGRAKGRDRDHDRLPDKWEKRHHLSTKHRSAKRDPDHDRLTNRREYRVHTNPRRADTDRDGLKDRPEVVRYKTSPRRADTDRDGYKDGVEVRAGTNPRNRRSHPRPCAPCRPAGSRGSGTTSASGVCGSAVANVADGKDPWGGCFPGPSNTGVPAGTALTGYGGPCTITAANTVIDGKTVNCDISVKASGLVIRNSVVNGAVLGDGSASFTISDSLIDGRNPYACINCGVGFRNFTVLRSEIVGTNRGAYCERTCVIKDSWIHGTNLNPVASNLAHASAVRVEQGTTLAHNTLACDYTGPFTNDEIGCSADISGYADFAPINHNTITSNLIASNNAGAGFCVYGGGSPGKPYSGDPTNATYVVYANNVFQRGANGKCGTYGPVTNFVSGRTGNAWTGNTWDNGTPVPPEN
jgi:hypothetical protein